MSSPRNHCNPNEAGAWEKEQGLAKCKPCQTNLITFHNKITFSVDMGGAVDIVSLDFSKVFDRASYSFLLDKLARYRLDWWAARWVGNWLTGHIQRAVIKSFYSGLQSVMSGVSQGSILGPTRFNIFINALSPSSWKTLNWVARWTCQEGESSYRQTWTGWKSGLARTACLTKTKAKPHTWDEITKENRTGLDLWGWRAALLKGTCWTTSRR